MYRGASRECVGPDGGGWELLQAFYGAQQPHSAEGRRKQLKREERTFAGAGPISSLNCVQVIPGYFLVFLNLPQGKLILHSFFTTARSFCIATKDGLAESGCSET